MPAKGTFDDKLALTKALNHALIRWEKMPLVSWFLDNTELEPDALANASGNNNCVRIQVLTPVGVLDREKKIGVTREMTDIVAAAANDPGLKRRTWVQIVEAPEGGWGIDGRAYANSEIAEEAKRQLAAQQKIG